MFNGLFGFVSSKYTLNGAYNIEKLLAQTSYLDSAKLFFGKFREIGIKLAFMTDG